MKFVGAHVSVSGGVSNAPVNAHEIGAKSFALFTRNPSRWKSAPISEAEAEKFKCNCQLYGFKPEFILPHDSYLINLGAPDAEKLQMSRDAFIDELRRCEQLGLTLLNFHPGSHLNMVDVDTCHIAKIIDKVDDKSRVGVCIDSCHAFAAGYDLSSDETFNAVWNDFDRTIGFNYLRGMHLNDTKKGLASKVDRHESIGKGILGQRFFQLLMNDSRFDNIPLILETPNPDIWAEEIKWLYEQEKK